MEYKIGLVGAKYKKLKGVIPTSWAYLWNWFIENCYTSFSLVNRERRKNKVSIYF
jgi:hypothetical protein